MVNGKVGDRRWKFLQGELKVEAKGQNAVRFLNIVKNRGLEVCDVNRIEDVSNDAHNMSFHTTIRDFKSMKDAARKTKTRIRISGRSGLPFFLFHMKKRRFMLAGPALFLFVVGLLSRFVWDISFEGNQFYSDEMLMNCLEENEVQCGSGKRSVDCGKLEEVLRDTLDRITWVSAELKGTQLRIQVREQKEVFRGSMKEKEACDLAAEKDGEVVSVVVRNGYSTVREGDYVTAGDCLIDGTIPILDDSGTEIKTYETAADGEVYAKTVHTAEWHLDRMETVKTKTGRTFYGLYLEVFGYSIQFPNLPEDRWEIVTEPKKWKLFRNFYLPVTAGIVRASEICISDRILPISEAEERMEHLLGQYMEKLMEKGVQILGCDGRIDNSESGWMIHGTIETIENIAMEKPTKQENE